MRLRNWCKLTEAKGNTEHAHPLDPINNPWCEMSKIFNDIVRRLDKNEPFVLATVVRTMGSAPVRVGARMVVTPEGLQGTVGGGALELEVERRAKAMLTGQQPGQLVTLDLTALKMGCGGEVTLFLEPFNATRLLWIFGGGHIASALVPLAAQVGFHVTVVDNRAEFADRDRFPAAAEVIHSPYDEAAQTVADDAYAVVITHAHTHDGEILEVLTSRTPPLPYIGMIGSKRKVATIVDQLTAAGTPPGPNLYAPIGLDIGGNSPHQIALAIAAELVAVNHDKTTLAHCRTEPT